MTPKSDKGKNKMSKRARLIEKAFGSARGTGPFVRDRNDREF